MFIETLVIILLVSLCCGHVCPTVDSSSYTIRAHEMHFSGENFSIIHHADVGPSSGDLYFMGKSESSQKNAFFMRSDYSTDTIQFMMVYEGEPSAESFVIEPNENYMYYIIKATNKIQLVQVNTTDGDVEAAFENTNIAQCDSDNCGIGMIDATKMYLSVYQNSGQQGQICKVDMASPLFPCFTMQRYFLATSMKVIDSTTIYYMALENTTDSHLLTQMVTYGTTTPIWGYKIECDTYPCDSIRAKTTVNDNIIYSVLDFDYNQNDILFIAQAEANGALDSVIRYEIDKTCTGLKDMTQEGDNIYFAITCTNDIIIMYDKSDQTFYSTIFESDYHINSLDIMDFTGNKHVLAAGSNNDMVAYYTIIHPNGFKYHPHASLTNINTLDATSTYTFTSFTWDVGSIGTQTLSAIAITESTPSLDLSKSSTFYTDAYYYLDTYTTTTLLESSEYSLPIDLTCSPTDDSNLTYYITSYPDYTMPDWVSLDSNLAILTLKTPDLGGNSQEFRFRVVTNIQDNSKDFVKDIVVIVIGCQVENCQECQSLEIGLCDTCEPGYGINQDSTKCESEFEQTVTVTQVTTLTAVAAAVLIQIISAAVSSSSAVGVWSLINQLQLLTLILLIRARLPEAIVEFLKGVEFCQFSFSFLKLQESGFTGEFSEMIGDVQTNSYLENIGVTSTSTLSNLLSPILMIICAICINIICTCLFKPRKCPWLSTKIRNFFHFRFYIRMFLELNQFILICSASEMFLNKRETEGHIFSNVVAYITYLTMISALTMVLVIWNKHSHDEHKFKIITNELNDGLKSDRLSLLYPFLSLLRRFMIINVILASLIFTSMEARYTVFFILLVNMPYYKAILLIRPFESIRDNIIEILNETVFVICILLLAYFNTKTRWDMDLGLETATGAYLYLIMTNSLSTLCIVTIDFGITLLKISKRCYKRRRSQSPSNHEQSNISNTSKTRMAQNVKKPTNHTDEAHFEGVRDIYKSNLKQNTNLPMNFYKEEVKAKFKIYGRG